MTEQTNTPGPGDPAAPPATGSGPLASSDAHGRNSPGLPGAGAADSSAGRGDAGR